jgi:glycine cleavage system H protein
VEKGKVFGSVESVKAVSDLYSPATGTVIAINEELTTAPEKINADAHATWIMKIGLADPAEIDSLLTAQDYETYVKEETGH